MEYGALTVDSLDPKLLLHILLEFPAKWGRDGRWVRGRIRKALVIWSIGMIRNGLGFFVSSGYRTAKEDYVSDMMKNLAFCIYKLHMCIFGAPLLASPS